MPNAIFTLVSIVYYTPQPISRLWGGSVFRCNAWIRTFANKLGISCHTLSSNNVQSARPCSYHYKSRVKSLLSIFLIAERATSGTELAVYDTVESWFVSRALLTRILLAPAGEFTVTSHIIVLIINFDYKLTV